MSPRACRSRYVGRLHVGADRQEACLAFECVFKTNATVVDSAKRASVVGLEEATDRSGDRPHVPEELKGPGILSAAPLVFQPIGHSRTRAGPVDGSSSDDG